MKKITIYSADWCPFCVRAKRLLEGKGLSFEEINVDQTPGQREKMAQKTGHKTIPMIFIEDKFIGGFSELSSLDQSGELDKMLKT